MSNYIKIPTYSVCDQKTLIKDIPNIINNNNEITLSLFKNIFEFGDGKNSQQYIKVPLITKGIVKGGSGQFFNLYANRISLSNESISNDFLNIITNHNLSKNRFKNSYEESIMNNYTHDVDSIIYNNNSLKTELDNLVAKVDKIYKESNYDASINDIYNKINQLDAKIEEIKDTLLIITNNLNINNSYNDTQNISTTNIDENEELLLAINSPTSSYTYSSDYYKNK